MINTNVKINFTLEVQMSRLNKSDTKFYISTRTNTLLIYDDRHEFYRHACKEMIDKIEVAELKGSDWHFQKINA